jgi:hypothetical protein
VTAPTTSAPTSIGPRLLTLAQVAERLTLSPRSVRVLIARGVLPTIQLTTRRKAVSESDLVAWIAARRAGGAS